jgi:hypothetical protein
MGGAYHACVEPWGIEDWTDFVQRIGIICLRMDCETFLGLWSGLYESGYG